SAARSSPPRSASTGSLTTVSGATRTATRDKSARAGPESGAACGTECAHAANSSTAAHTFTLLRRDLHLRIRLDAALVALRLHLGEIGEHLVHLAPVHRLALRRDHRARRSRLHALVRARAHRQHAGVLGDLHHVAG